MSIKYTHTVYKDVWKRACVYQLENLPENADYRLDKELTFSIITMSRRVLIIPRLPNSPLFLIWEIILKLQIASSSARDSTSKLETRPWEISSAFGHSASLRSGDEAPDKERDILQTIPRYLGMIIPTKFLANCNFGLMKTQISWIVCNQDSSNSRIFGNL